MYPRQGTIEAFIQEMATNTDKSSSKEACLTPSPARQPKDLEKRDFTTENIFSNTHPTPVKHEWNYYTLLSQFQYCHEKLIITLPTHPM
jgi:hypothetical protein